MTRPTLARLGPSLGPGLLMLAIALTGAGHPVLSWDEIATADVASRSPAQIGELIRHIDGVFGPYYYLEHFWTHLAGTSELDLRLPSILAMSGAVALTGELGRRLYGPVTGALAGLLLGLMPNTSRYAAEARPYAFACFFALLALLLLHAAVDRPHPARWALYGVSLVFLGLAHVIALTTLAAHAVVLRRRGSRRTVGWWAAAAVLALAALAPILWLGVHERGAQLSWVPPLTGGGLWKFPGQVVGSVAGGWLLLGLAVLALVRPRPGWGEVAAFALGPIVAVAAVSVLVAPYWVARYLLVVLAPLALLAAAALHDVVSAEPLPATPFPAAPRPAGRPSPGPLSAGPLSAEPLSAAPLSARPLSAGPLSAAPLSAAPLSAAPLSARPLSAEPPSAESLSAEPPSAEPLSAEPLSAEPASDRSVLPGALLSDRRPILSRRWLEVARLAAVVALLACAVYPGQRAVRTATAKNGSDYRTAAAIILAEQHPGDGLAYTANSRTMRTGLSYYLRHDHSPPQDVLLERTAAQDGTLKAVEFAPTPSRLARTQRLWLLVYGVHQDPLTVRADLRTAFEGRFRRTRVWFLHRETLALFVRLTPSSAPPP